MEQERELSFGPYRLDPLNEWIWRGKQTIRLTGKAFAVLRYLLEHAGQVVTKDELFDAVWAGITVTDAALAVCIKEIRRALKDDAKTPQFIETAHRRGYRFIAPVERPASSVPRRASAGREREPTFYALRPTPYTLHPTPYLVGRERELTQLHGWLDKARVGQRQIVFVTGEPGIGKTTLVEAFLDRITHADELWIGWGPCIEHFGSGEAYLPVLEAFGQLCRGPGRERLVEILSVCAPTWLVQMPAVLGATDLEALQRRVQGTTRERMLREMAETLEVLTAERPLVLVLEDLHWSDYATLDLLSFLARRRQPARLLLIGTYRPVDVLVSEHPLKGVKQELQLHGHCEELALPLLTPEGVEKYLVARFAAGEIQRTPLQKLARTIYRRTDGNPLFMVNVVGYLATQGVIGEDQERWEPQRGIEAVEGGVPENLRQMVEKQLDRLAPEEQRVLEAASVAGVEFVAAAVAAALEVEVGRVEKWCEELVRRGQLLRAQGLIEWPDGTVSGRYGFIHALYQEVLYQRVSAGRRIRLHCKIGEREEQGYGAQATEIAVELAVRFEQGRDYRRAIQYLRNAGEKAIRRCANQEAVGHLQKGLALVQSLPESAERTQQELMLQIALGRPLMAMKGWGDPEVTSVYARALELCRQVDETPQLCPVLFGLCAFYASRAAYETARDLGEQLLQLARKAQEPDFLLEAHLALGQSLFWLGQLPAAHAHLEQGNALYDPRQHSSHVFLYGQDPGVGCRRWGAMVLWFLGYPDQALRKSQDALTMAERLAHPFSLVSTLSLAAGLHQLRREAHAAHAQAEAVLALAREQGFAQWVVVGMIQKGWALTAHGHKEEGMTQIRQALATGAELRRPYFLCCLAEASEKAGQIEDALTILGEAFTAIQKTEEHVFEAELYRLKGELLLQFPVPRAQLPIPR